MPDSRLSEITKGERGVSVDTALRLERYFGSEAKGWLNLQAAYALRMAEIENGKAIAKEIRPMVLKNPVSRLPLQVAGRFFRGRSNGG